MKKEIIYKKMNRESNIELLRILATFGIVFSHATQYMYGENWWEGFYTRTSLNVILSMLLGIWGQVSVAVFIVISSYFLCDSRKVNYFNAFKLIIQTITLNFVVHILYIIYEQKCTIFIVCKSIGKAIASPFSGEYWFITGYIFLVIIQPILREFIRNKNKEVIKKTCFMLMIFTLIGDLVYIRVGGSVMDFLCVYLLTAYIKKYYNNEFDKVAKKVLISNFLLIFVISVLLNIIATGLNRDILYHCMTHIFVNWNIMIIFGAIGVFWCFKRLKIKKNRFINTLARSSLGIYLLSENSITSYSGTKSILWCEIMQLDKMFDSKYFIFVLLIAVILVYMICFIIDNLRNIIFEKTVYKSRLFVGISEYMEHLF